MVRMMAGLRLRGHLPLAMVAFGAACLSVASLALAQPAKPSGPSPETGKSPTETGKGPAEPLKVGCDAACTRQALPAAIQACVPGIERQAPTDFDWMQRPTGTIFQQAEPSTGSDPVAKFRGDSIRFLSPQGQWVRVTYECDYDAVAQTVRGVRVRLGRIDGKAANEGTPSRLSAAPNQVAAPTPAQGRRPRPSEPNEVEIRQVSPASRR